MTQNKINKIGILAYGSLIDYPGIEISEIDTDRISCQTPFKVEFARTSSKRGNAPTLIPVENGGQMVKAQIIVIPEDTGIEKAASILWRRELHKTNRIENYIPSAKPTLNTVIIKKIKDFMNVSTVLYTSIGCNIKQILTGKLLADFAIESILSSAGKDKKDGLRYLLSTKRNGIVTPLSQDYENQILRKTGTKSLEEAIEKLDKKRVSNAE